MRGFVPRGLGGCFFCMGRGYLRLVALYIRTQVVLVFNCLFFCKLWILIRRLWMI